MHLTSFASRVLSGARTSLAVLALAQIVFAPVIQAQQSTPAEPQTPIKHVIIIVGENRTFDHIFATYKPRHGNTVNNLLSEKIIDEDGNPGPNFSRAAQYSADVTGSSTFQLSPPKKALYPTLPAPLTGGPSDVCANNGICTLAQAASSENGLAKEYEVYLLTGGTGLPGHTPDSRITGVNSTAPYSTLKSGPFQLTNTNTTDSFPYDSYAASPVHRFYQMWQQFDCSAARATRTNPSGCLADLFPWVEVSVGSNANGIPLPANYSADYAPGAYTTGEGSTSMGFYNMHQGDAPYTKYLADNYAISDNYHQPVMGGTGANSIMLGFGDVIWFSDGKGNAAVPPHNQATPFGGPVDEIENPNPQTGTNNWWIQDGYGGFTSKPVTVYPNTTATGVYGGGSYTNCSDSTQPGVEPILNYLASLKPAIKPNCDAGHYYLLNNYNPGYFGDGSNAYLDTNSNNTPFTIPPVSQRSIADVLSGAGVTWKYYGDQWTPYLTDPYQLNYGAVGATSDQYCNICNPFQYSTSVMTNPSMHANLVDTTQLYADIQSGNLPAVSYVKPSGWVDGHPASSKWNLFEGFVKKIVDEIQLKPDLWASTAIFITTDEGGGYYDSGYVQPLDFFGDGTRIPLLVVSPHVIAGHVSHDYADHVSLLKFIERNWKLSAISSRSRDNYPNPKYDANVSKYAPTNSPALSDLFDLFDFGSHEE
jgi:phospholipase C